MNSAAATAPRGKNPGHSSGLTRLRRNDSSQRILVQPGDTLLLRYTPCEEALNFGIVTFFTFGIGELLRN